MNNSSPRVGHINFLNMLPLSYSFAHGAAEGLTLIRGVPSVLNSDLISGRLDVAGVSSIAYARHSEELLLLPKVCVSSDGPVQSIVLVSKKPIEALGKDKVILTAKSATSHCLLKIILRGAYGAIPNYYTRNITTEEPVPADAAASLFIGDDALWLYHHPPAGLYLYDIGQEWKQLTGQKMVYALWCVRREFANKHPESVKLIQERIHGAFLSFIRNALPGPARPAGGLSYRETIIRSGLEEKRFTYDQLADYLGPVVRWDLTEEYLQGLNTFYTMAHEMNLIEHMPKIQFAKISE